MESLHAIRVDALDAADRLRTTIRQIDELQQYYLDQIEAVARLALYAMESPEAMRHPGDIAAALQLIEDRAAHLSDVLNSEAEAVEANKPSAAATDGVQPPGGRAKLPRAAHKRSRTVSPGCE